MDVSSFVLQSGAVASASLTVTRSKLFAGVRENTGKFPELLKCPYCFSHWAALAVAAPIPHNPNPTYGNWFVYWFALVAASAIVMGTISRLFLSQESKIEELESDLEQATELLRKLDTGVKR